MKILLAVQGTGNGHISRARDIIPHLAKYGQVDTVVSGTQADVQLDKPATFRFNGFSFVFGKKGGVSNWRTLKNFKPAQLFKDVFRFKLEQYDLILNDFEPVIAWACKMRRVTCTALSHQSSFLSPKTPRPGGDWNWAEMVLRYYAPTRHAVAFHFKRYDHFIHTPVIRQEIRRRVPQNKGHYTVYLPAYDDRTLATYLTQLPKVQWEVFSKHTRTPYVLENVKVHPVDNALFNESMGTCEGLLTGGGFEGPAEALFLGKKLMSIPMKGQWEQQCNAEALRLMGVPVIAEIREGFTSTLKEWVLNSAPVKVDFPDETAGIIDRLIQKSEKNG